MAKQDNYYDEDLHDQDPRPDSTAPDKNNSADDSADDEGDYATFLAPKASFAGKNLAVGAVHRVRIERVLGDEVELRCIKPSEPKGEGYESDMPDKEDAMYT